MQNSALPATTLEIRRDDEGLRPIPLYNYEQLQSLSQKGLLTRVRQLEDLTGDKIEYRSSKFLLSTLTTTTTYE